MLNPNNGCGLDGIPQSVLRFSRDLLAQPLTLLFNDSLKSGHFPDVLKKGYVIPIFKCSDRQDVRNYRPETIFSAVANLFEKLILDKMAMFFKSIIPSCQHGFMPVDLSLQI